MTYKTTDLVKEFQKFSQVVELNKQKILNKQIVTRNLKKTRSDLEALRDIVNGSLAEFVALKELREFIQNSRPDLALIEYDKIRVDKGAYPDLFDAVLCKKNNEVELRDKLTKIVVSYTEQCERSIRNTYKCNAEAIKSVKLLATSFPLRSIEIKSSKVKNITTGTEDRPTIAYIKDKFIFDWKDPGQTKPIGKNGKVLKPISAVGDEHMVYFSKDEYLEACFPGVASREDLEKLYFNNSATLKDIHIQVFFKDPPDIKGSEKAIVFTEKTVVDISSFQDLLSPEFSKSRCVSWQEIVEGEYIGTTSSYMNALYHLRGSSQPKVGCSIETFINRSFPLEGEVAPVALSKIRGATHEEIDRFYRAQLNEKKNDKGFVMAALAHRCDIYKSISSFLKNDVEILEMALNLDGSNICHASVKFRKESLNANKYAVEKNPWALKVVDNKYKDCEDVVLIAVKGNPEVFSEASERLRKDKDFLLRLLNENINCLDYASKEIVEKLEGQSNKVDYFRSWCEKERLEVHCEGLFKKEPSTGCSVL